ncbi:hypothetical protein PG994_006137 [Apiospora phragmitis]|uniref:Transcription factor TFIIIC triple barrel domain-containing protein n=1 Tax=Apiospora phragmitis TaxID=2905665 RepID=A0ABR1VE73_9PEZI
MDNFHQPAAFNATRPDPTLTNTPASLSLDKEEDSDWEYEYSTTETETYYVTLDISKTDFISKQQKTVMNGRGGLKEKSHDEMLAIRFSEDRAKFSRDPTADDDEGDGEFADQGNDPDATEEVQILELHSANPVISYRGRIYEGQWSENVGSEVILTQHNDAEPLPAIQQLDGDIDLLAVSSARIMTTEKVLKPINEKTMRRQRKIMFDEDDYEISDSENNQELLVPRPEPGASRARVEQGDFLAKFIELKRKMGETDEVTVVAKTKENISRRKSTKKPRHGQRARRNQLLGGLQPQQNAEVGGRAGSNSRTMSSDENGSRSTPAPQHELHGTTTMGINQDDDGQVGSGDASDEGDDQYQASGDYPDHDMDVDDN